MNTLRDVLLMDEQKRAHDTFLKFEMIKVVYNRINDQDMVEQALHTLLKQLKYVATCPFTPF